MGRKPTRFETIMADQEQTQTITAPAPSSGNISRTHVYTDIINITFGDGRTTLDDDLWEVVADYIPGIGNVELNSITVIFLAPKADMTVKLGVCNTAANLTVDQVAMKENGVYFVSTSLTAGKRHVEHVIPEDTISRQLFPVDSKLPMCKIIVSVTEGVAFTLQVKLKVNGMRQHYGLLKG